MSSNRPSNTNAETAAGLPGPPAASLANAWQEHKVTNLHHGLARYMGIGAPAPFV